VKQGDLELLPSPVAQELLHSKIPARLAYIWMDGTPRVVPIWFHWNGLELIMATPPKAPKLKALAKNPKVSLTIDDNNFPHKVLLIRGTASLQHVDGMVSCRNMRPPRSVISARNKGRCGSSKSVAS
jgi:Pyridoxamine 5'-phosphate oxidase